ncbi:MAG TPA: hypothetical protein QGF58_05085 [Myxococcota bacterium]|nr:hypothetical protein [Myxococcota bacterium]
MWLIIACGQVPESDGRRFVRQLGGSPEACAAIDDARLRGHCQLANGAACEEVEVGPWQDECWFSLAEHIVDDDEAVSTCTKAGLYAGDCLTHLFKAQVDDDLAAAEALEMHYDELGAGDWEPPWGWWWRRHHQRAPRLDRSCAELSPPQTRRCLREAIPALRLAYRSALSERPREHCGLALEELRKGKIPWVADTELDAVVVEELEAACP